MSGDVLPQSDLTGHNARLRTTSYTYTDKGGHSQVPFLRPATTASRGASPASSGTNTNKTSTANHSSTKRGDQAPLKQSDHLSHNDEESPRQAEPAGPRNVTSTTDSSSPFSATTSATQSSMDFRPLEIERSSRQNRRRPIHGPPPPKTTLAAALMLVGGLILLAVGLGLRYDKDPKENERGLAMMILGCIIFIPGSYACVQLYGAWMGWPGYHYNNLPSYDD